MTNTPKNKSIWMSSGKLDLLECENNRPKKIPIIGTVMSKLFVPGGL